MTYGSVIMGQAFDGKAENGKPMGNTVGQSTGLTFNKQLIGVQHCN